MENYLTQITNYLLTQSWQIAVLVVVITGVNLALKNKSAHVRYLLWLIVLAKCLVPPLLTVPLAVLPQEKLAEPVPVSPVQVTAVPIVALDTTVPETPTPLVSPVVAVTTPAVAEKAARLTLRQCLGFGWIVGVAAFLLFAVIKALRTNFWLWRQRKLLPAELQTIVKELFSGLGIKTFPKVWLLSGIGQPFVWGLLRGGIYLPAEFVKLNNAEQRRGILGHELGHIVRFDAAVNILQIIGQAIFWFHPFVWWANRKIRAEREKCCDEMAITHLGAKAKDYSSAIVNILISEYESTRPVPSLAVAGPVKNIEERIKTMMKPGKKFYKRPSLIAATIVLLLAVLTVPTAIVLTARAETQVAAQREENMTESLHEAALAGDIDQVKALISKGADVDVRSGPGKWTPLYLAVSRGHRDLAELLINQGADVNARDAAHLETPLHRAVTSDHMEMVELLTAKGADVNAKNQVCWTPLHLIAMRGHKDVGELLLTKGPNVNARDNWRYTPLHWTAWYGNEDVAELLITKSADLNAQNIMGRTPLHVAAERGVTNIVELLLAKNADVNAEDNQCATPLWYAKNRARKEIVELLLKYGAKEKAPVMSLHLAARKGYIELVKSLISKGADVNAMDDRLAGTPLHLAAFKGRREVVEFLIANGANVNAKNKWGQTPLHGAIDKGHTEIVELLRKHGAKVDISVGAAKTKPAKSLLESATSQFTIPKKNLEIPEQMQSCAANLRKIYTATKKYEKDKGNLPNWLSDLVPDYVGKEMLLCPHNPKRDPFKGLADPKLLCSYTYEFPLSRTGAKFGGAPSDGMTKRDQKMAQMKLFGDVVPFIRCRQHGPMLLNIAVGGQIYLSPISWEHMFMPEYTVGLESSQ